MLENLYSQNKNEFWKYLKSMKGTSNSEDLPQMDRLIKYFKNLYFDEKPEIKITNIYEGVDQSNKQKFNVLNEEINEKEVTV